MLHGHMGLTAGWPCSNPHNRGGGRKGSHAATPIVQRGWPCAWPHGVDRGVGGGGPHTDIGGVGAGPRGGAARPPLTFRGVVPSVEAGGSCAATLV